MTHLFRDKSFDFAVKIVLLCKSLRDEHHEYTLSKQLLKAGTSIAANHREAEHAQSKVDFIHKMSIAQKECNETIFWLELLFATKYIDDVEYERMHGEATELIKMATAAIKTTKRSL